MSNDEITTILTPRVGVIILAAGGSSRFGRPKQLLPYQGNTLIRRATETCLASLCYPVIVVLGACSGEIAIELDDLPVILVENSKWQTGLSSSIKSGLAELAAWENGNSYRTDATLLMLSDQPFLTAAHLDEMVRRFSLRGGIIASAYNGTIGVPAIFSIHFRPELAPLPAGQGAKVLIERYPEKVHTLDFPDGIFDVDTQEDYEKIIRSNRSKASQSS